MDFLFVFINSSLIKNDEIINKFKKNYSLKSSFRKYFFEIKNEIIFIYEVSCSNKKKFLKIGFWLKLIVRNAVLDAVVSPEDPTGVQ